MEWAKYLKPHGQYLFFKRDWLRKTRRPSEYDLLDKIRKNNRKIRYNS